MTRRQFLLSLFAAGAGGLTYSRFIEPQWLEVSEVTVRLPKARLKAPVTILHLSDLHWSKVVGLSFIGKALALGLARQPDLICLTGDFITTQERYDFSPYVDLLKNLCQTTPTFAVLGNHDGGAWSVYHGGVGTPDEVVNLLKSSGIMLLSNQSRPISIKGNVLYLVGVDDLWSERLNPQQAFRDVPEGRADATIVLAHNPDSKEWMGQYAWDLMLSGHTHGGQIVIPFLGAPFAPVRDLRYVAGLNPWNERWIYTTRGVGNLWGIRINCRPQVSMLHVE